MTLLAQRQAVRAAGFAGGRLLIDKRRTYWTLTLWDSEKSMKAFRGSGAHGRVMPKLVEWRDEAAYAHWITEGNSIPDWPEACEQLLREGRLSRVARPSPDHESLRFPEPRLRPLIGQDLKPPKKYAA